MTWNAVTRHVIQLYGMQSTEIVMQWNDMKLMNEMRWHEN